MKRNHVVLVALLTASLAFSEAAFAQTSRFDELANLSFKENRPTEQTAQTLRDELLFQRATQTYLWALPLINTLGMKTGSEKVFGAGYNVLPVWKKRLAEYEMPPMDDAIAEELTEFVDRRKQELPDEFA